MVPTMSPCRKRFPRPADAAAGAAPAAMRAPTTAAPTTSRPATPENLNLSRFIEAPPRSLVMRPIGRLLRLGGLRYRVMTTGRLGASAAPNRSDHSAREERTIELLSHLAEDCCLAIVAGFENECSAVPTTPRHVSSRRSELTAKPLHRVRVADFVARGHTRPFDVE